MFMGRTLRSLGMRSSLGQMGWGAGLGAGYGAVSNDTSVVGGAAMGLGLGIAGPIGAASIRGARRGYGIGRAYSAVSAPGSRWKFAGQMGLGYARAAANLRYHKVKALGQASGFQIGRTLTKGWNSFKNLF